jgi:segregation and condensation protein B
MSLKAKLEAVIYAAEEPVTLAQLTVLFAGEAFALKAEQDSAAEVVEETVADPSADAPAAVELLESGRELGAELTELLVTPEHAGDGLAERVELGESAAVVLEENAAEPASTVSAEDAELEARRLERKRDRDAREILRGILDELIAEYASDGRGIEIREIAGGFRMGTKFEMHDAVRAFVKSLKPPMKLSLPALETLAVIAYKQPVTAPEVGEIRGVDSAGVLGSLMSRKLIATAGRKQVIGRPMLYKTTKEFLLRFGLKDLNELPSMEEFEKMAALELSEGDAGDDAAVSGDLFGRDDAADTPEEEMRPEELIPEAQDVSTPTAEPSEEAADAQAPVERQDAEEIEVER